MRRYLFLITTFVICQISLRALASQVGGVETDSSGNTVIETQAGAAQYCKAKGLRLPTARELVGLTITMGAKPIRETSYKNMATNTQAVKAEIDRNFKDGYYAFLQAGGSAKLVVDFYYNPTGYRPPEGDGQAGFWSSTPGISPETGSLLLGMWGELAEAADLKGTAAVRCAN